MFTDDWVQGHPDDAEPASAVESEMQRIVAAGGVRPVPEPGTCACGLLLHYTDPTLQQAMMQIVKLQGEMVVVTTPAGSWRVQRHFIALHGLTTRVLSQLGFERIAEESVE